jgi:hypothetical protein
MTTRSIFILALLGLFQLNALAALPANTSLRVVIVRHGEKPDDNSNHNLSCQGFNRALQLPKAIVTNFGVPDYAYASRVKGGKTTSQARMFQTITPFAVRYGLQINTKFAEDDTTDIARDVLSKSGTVLLVWEHKAIASIVKALGVDGKHKWSGQDFDSVWIVDFVKDSNGTLNPIFRVTNENITPSPDCNF